MKMKKKIGIALLFVVALFSATCGNTEGENLFGVKEIGGAQSNFCILEEYNKFDVIYDRETGVMYTMSSSSRAYGILTPLLNADGTPKIYQGGE